MAIANKPDDKMSPLELKSSASLALIFFMRMFGLFLILPVFALYATDLKGANPGLIGIGLGIYGLSQALFQIPFGMLSDRFGRKPIIACGLCIFMIGSLIAGLADNIYIVILGRTLQGAGAIASAVMALAADLTREQHRTKAMAIIGMSIGFAFSLSFVLGPILASIIQLSGLFFVSAALAILAIFVLFYMVPTPAISEFHGETGIQFKLIMQVIKNKMLLGFDVGIFFLHLTLTANFIAIPFALHESLGIQSAEHWQIYLPVILLSILFIVPFIMLADRKQLMPIFYISAIGLLAASQILMAFIHDNLWFLYAELTLFFFAFNYLEASLPSLISKSVTGNNKGTALGVYSTSQFIGTFLGGAMGGLLFEKYSYEGVFLLGTGSACLWLIIAGLLAKEMDASINSARH